jgi:hypothetical protein
MLFRQKKQKKKSAVILPTDMNPCLSGKEIFKQNPDWLQEIRDQISATAQVYEKTYLDTLYRVAEFCQSMPDKAEDKNYSLLRQQLDLCVTTLRLRKGLLLPPNAGAETMAREEARWTYACFAASLLYGISRIQKDRTITFYNDKGEDKGKWQLLSGSLFKPDFYFKLKFESSQEKEFPDEAIMNVLSAHLISPEIIHWMSQNSELFSVWWGMVGNTDNV